MFYEENEISELLNCKRCKERLCDPRVLNCGNTLCKSCIDSLTISINSKTYELDCCFCCRFHQIPLEGFPVNHLIKRLANKRATQVYRGELAEKLQSQLDELSAKCDELKFDFINVPNKLKANSNDLRNQVDIATDEIIDLLNKYRETFYNQIKDFENKSLLNYNQNYNNFEKKINDFFTDVKGFHDYWSSYLKKPSINDFKLVDANAHTRKWLENVEKLEMILTQITSDNKMLKFEGNVNGIRSNVIGLLMVSDVKNNTNLKNKTINKIRF